MDDGDLGDRVKVAPLPSDRNRAILVRLDDLLVANVAGSDIRGSDPGILDRQV
jgi:hypothetical protein